MQKILSGGVLLLLVWLVTACSPTANDPATAATPDPDVVEAARGELPIPESGFRSDLPERVAATGRPQLIEFYAEI